jgi:hypothetical protein
MSELSCVYAARSLDASRTSAEGAVLPLPLICGRRLFGF